MTIFTERASVPCGTCNACCHGDAVTLRPDHGDHLDDYLYEMAALPVFGLWPVLKKVDGHCVYLKDGRCSIWSRAPAVCRAFDCRRFYLSRSRAERRRMVREGLGGQAVMKAGKDRLHTLSEAEKKTIPTPNKDLAIPGVGY